MRTTETHHINSDPGVDFIFTHAIKYFNMFVTHSRYILELFFRLGLFFLIDANPFNINLLIVGSSLFVASLIFFITQKIKKDEKKQQADLKAHQITLPDNVLNELEKIQRILKASQRTERTYINAITNFMDINMLCTFSFFILQTYIPITRSILTSVFVVSCIVSTALHYFYFEKSMMAEDNTLEQHLSSICLKAKRGERNQSKVSPTAPGLLLLMIDSLFYTGLTIASLIIMPDNMPTILLNTVLPYVWLIGTPTLLALAVCFYKSQKFRNIVFSFLSACTTTSTLSLMGFKYISLFPIIQQILFLRVGPLMFFKTACVYFGILTGVISHRVFNRSLEITSLINQHQPITNRSPQLGAINVKSGSSHNEEDRSDLRTGPPTNGSNSTGD